MAVVEAENMAANMTTMPMIEDNEPYQSNGAKKRSFLGSCATALDDSEYVAAKTSTALVPRYTQTSIQSSLALPAAPTYVSALDLPSEPPMPNNIALAGSPCASELAISRVSEMQAVVRPGPTSRSVTILDDRTSQAHYYDADEESDAASYSPAGTSEWWAPSRKATDCSFASRRTRTESRL